MSRSVFLPIRVFLILASAILTCLYVMLASSSDNNKVDYATSTVCFLAAYMIMVGMLSIFTRIRKYDIAIFNWAIASIVVVVQLWLSSIPILRVPFPTYAEATSMALGILTCLLPMFISKMRGEYRNERLAHSYLQARRSVTLAPYKSLDLVDGQN